MNLIRSHIILLLSFFLCTASLAQITPKNRDLYLDKALTGKVIKPINIRVKHSKNDEQTYFVKLEGKWTKGACQVDGVALLADLNFDGKADLWITGYKGSLERLRCSDVWLFNTRQNKYIYNAKLSAIQNLEVAPKEKIIEGGMHNCGCAAYCYFYDDYVWINANKLKKFARRAGDCVNHSEFSLVNGSLKKTLQIDINKKENENRQKNYHFLDWSTNGSQLYDQIQQQAK